MSSFVHGAYEFNTLAKYFKEVIGLDADFTDNLIFNLYQFELKGVNSRYDEDNQLDIEIYEGKKYSDLELITSYDALKLLDSIKYQSADMESEVLWKCVLNVHKKLCDGIVVFEGLEKEYDKTPEYSASQWW